MNTYKVKIITADKSVTSDLIESPNIRTARKQAFDRRAGKKDIRQEVSRIYKISK